MSETTKRLIAAVLESLPDLSPRTCQAVVDEVWAQMLRLKAAQKRAELGLGPKEGAA